MSCFNQFHDSVSINFVIGEAIITDALVKQSWLMQCINVAIQSISWFVNQSLTQSLIHAIMDSQNQSCTYVYIYIYIYIRMAVRWVCCSVLQCVAVCCSVLQCVAVCCSPSSIQMSDGFHDWFAQWRVHMWDMIYPYVGHDSSMCATWLTHTYGRTHYYRWMTGLMFESIYNSRNDKKWIKHINKFYLTHSHV